MNPDIAACAGIVQKGDPDRFLAIMSGPLHLREKLFPLYAMNVEVARAPWVTQESMIAEMRLQWWRDALEEIAKGGEVRRHEVVTPLSEVLNSKQAEALYVLVEARRWDIYKDPFEDVAAFQTHLDDTAGVLLAVAAELAGASETQHIQTVGRVDGLARWFQAIPALEAQGRIPLVDGRASAVAELAKEALADFKMARVEIGRVDRDVAAVLRLTWQSSSLLKQAMKNPNVVQEGNLYNGEFRNKFSLLWKSLNANW
ncbi:squalene/phytoene synthase family protein [Cognatishimia activa]|uniref:squalene/phytoene synthase family protein n=1 Tax=Cognatishimia activa TaxID=1715691 RepID=UPI00223277E8|nr:squalene/phytoene synthase family protein [Cognatishimia activa]UZD92297.1 squalene/phytoene synthase family protein [Cognatishimia activa]